MNILRIMPKKLIKKTILKKNDTDNFEDLGSPECLEEHTTRNTTVNCEKKLKAKQLLGHGMEWSDV